MCVYECLPVQHTYVQCSQRPEESTGSHGTIVSSCWVLGTKAAPSAEWQCSALWSCLSGPTSMHSNKALAGASIEMFSSAHFLAQSLNTSTLCNPMPLNIRWKLGKWELPTSSKAKGNKKQGEGNYKNKKKGRHGSVRQGGILGAWQAGLSAKGGIKWFLLYWLINYLGN